MPGVFPLACAKARFAPVYVGDVAKIMVASIENQQTFNQSLELCGPHTYSLKELVQYAAKICGYKRMVIGLPMFMSKFQAAIFEHVPGKPFSMDNFNSLKLDSICRESTPCTTPLQAIAPMYLANNKTPTTKRERN
jgi:NADH dehydrogenase